MVSLTLTTTCWKPCQVNDGRRTPTDLRHDNTDSWPEHRTHPSLNDLCIILYQTGSRAFCFGSQCGRERGTPSRNVRRRCEQERVRYHGEHCQGFTPGIWEEEHHPRASQVCVTEQLSCKGAGCAVDRPVPKHVLDLPSRAKDRTGASTAETAAAPQCGPLCMCSS